MRTVRASVPFEATTALRGRDDSVMAPPTVRSERGAARGVGIHGAELHNAEQASSTRGAACCITRGGREPGGVRHTECARVVTAEVGDGLTAMPLVFSAGRANGRRRTWDSEHSRRCTSAHPVRHTNRCDDKRAHAVTIHSGDVPSRTAPSSM
jgi:hypothetical protein